MHHGFEGVEVSASVASVSRQIVGGLGAPRQQVQLALSKNGVFRAVTEDGLFEQSFLSRASRRQAMIVDVTKSSTTMTDSSVREESTSPEEELDEE